MPVDWGSMGSPQGTPQQAPAPAPSGSAVPKVDWGSMQRVVKKLEKTDKQFAKVVTKAKSNPVESTLGWLGASQRALQAFETGGDVRRAWSHPEDADKLSRAVRERIGLQQLEDAADKTPAIGSAVAGAQTNPIMAALLGSKFGRGTLNTIIDMGNDPLNLLGGEDFIAKQVLGRIPAAARAGNVIAKPLQAAGRKILEYPVGRALNPEAGLEGLSAEAKARFLQLANVGREEGVESGRAGTEAVRKAKREIEKTGAVPAEVARLFHDPANIPVAKKGFLRPEDIAEALRKDRAAYARAQTTQKIKKATPGELGLPMMEHETAKAGREAMLAKLNEPSLISPEFLKRLHLNENPLRGATNLANKAFLASGLPHTLNLANLAFNEGPITALRGAGNALRFAVGKPGKKLAQTAEDLKAAGGHHEFENVFNEMGIQRLAGIPGTELPAKAINAALTPVQRFANQLQRSTLNPLEAGFRTAMFRRMVEKEGVSAAEAARRINRELGTEMPTAVNRAISELGGSFPNFHINASLGSAGRTLVKHPGRFVAPLKADKDYNDQFNPGKHKAKFHLGIPTLAAARFAADPVNYMFNFVNNVTGPYSPLGQAMKGHPIAAARQAVGGFLPGGGALNAGVEKIRGKKGKYGEDPLIDLITSLTTGGYYQKPK